MKVRILELSVFSFELYAFRGLGNYQESRFDPRFRTEGRGQKAEDRGRKSEGGRQRTVL